MAFLKPVEYAELIAQSSFSFLEGASTPEELIEQSQAIGQSAIAITDTVSVAGLPRAHAQCMTQLRCGATLPLLSGGPVALLVQTHVGWRQLCRWITRAKSLRPVLDREALAEESVVGGSKGLIALPFGDFREDWADLIAVFGRANVVIPVSRHGVRGERRREADKLERLKPLGLSIVAVNEVRAHDRDRMELQRLFRAIRHGKRIEALGTLALPNREWVLKSPQDMAALFSDHPEWVNESARIADRCTFRLSELKYLYPSEWIPVGETAQSHLVKRTWEGAHQRYPDGIDPKVRSQLEHELKLIEELKYADYFLTIDDIVSYAREQKILCQGRGSAANSAVCFVLGITAIDPARSNLLFERFLSKERSEPPDIDVDFEHERREEVIQHIYSKYGRNRAGMVAAVVTYQGKLARREILRAYGLEKWDDPHALEERERQLAAMRNHPRHLSIHSGGFTLSQERLDEIVPIQPAAMEGRTIIQWDKDSLESLGLLKVDVLALGMLTALRKTMHYARIPELAALPAEDPETYAMMCRADTVGVFQIESRAQMSMLPRLRPEKFYDLVVEVALVRPGPIVGKMVHPYLRRRRGEEAAELPDPRLEPILGRTFGIPIFQEQVMQMSMVLAGFTPGEADELRRSMGTWKRSGKMGRLAVKLRDALLTAGLPPGYVETVFHQIQGFSEYGFPESHAASFALLAYASSYLKCHYPTEFLCGLLNSQPLGFYSSRALIHDAVRHGVKVLPICVQDSGEFSEMRALDGGVAVRLGFHLVKGMEPAEIAALLAMRTELNAQKSGVQPLLPGGSKPPTRHFDAFTPWALIAALPAVKISTWRRLAAIGAFAHFGVSPRELYWWLLEQSGPMYEQLELESVSREYWQARDQAHPSDLMRAELMHTGVTTQGHPVARFRKQLSSVIAKRVWSAQQIRQEAVTNQPIQAFGMFIVRQAPPTANGVIFSTLEDETGLLDLAFLPQHHKGLKRDDLPIGELVIVKGIVQRERESLSILVKAWSSARI